MAQSAEAAVTKYHSLGGISNRYLLLSSGGWKVQDQGADWLGFC
jgi:hypothetical protein